MKKQILLIAAKLLRMASDTYSNNGRNDIGGDLLKLINTINTTELCADIRRWYGDEAWPQNISCLQDFVLMDYVADKLAEEAEKENLE